jgi:hypothetical protein
MQEGIYLVRLKKIEKSDLLRVGSGSEILFQKWDDY